MRGRNILSCMFPYPHRRIHILLAVNSMWTPKDASTALRTATSKHSRKIKSDPKKRRNKKKKKRNSKRQLHTLNERPRRLNSTWTLLSRLKFGRKLKYYALAYPK